MFKNALRAAALVLGLLAPASAAYIVGPTISTNTGTASETIAGYFNVAASSVSSSTPTIILNGPTGTITALKLNVPTAISSTVATSTMTAGIDGSTPVLLPENPIAASCNTSGDCQVNVQNQNPAGTSGYTATADTGNNTSRFWNCGINNSAYNGSAAGYFDNPYDVFCLANGGNFDMFVQTPGQQFQIFVGGNLAPNIALQVASTGTTVAQGSLSVSHGGVSAATGTFTGALAAGPTTISGQMSATGPLSGTSITGSSATLTASGANQPSIQTSSGIVVNAGTVKIASQAMGCAQFDSSGNLWTTASACSSASGNMSTSGTNNMASGSQINEGSGAQFNQQSGSTSTAVVGSSVTLNAGGTNAMVEIIQAEQSYAYSTPNVCPSTITWTLSNYLQPWETAASSITWRVYWNVQYSSTTTFYVLSEINNDVLAHYGYTGITSGIGSGVNSFYANPNAAYGLALTPDSGAFGVAGPGAIGTVTGFTDYETDATTTTYVNAYTTNTSLIYNGTHYNSMFGDSGIYEGAAVMTSIELTATSESPSSGQGTVSQHVPMCGDFRLYRSRQHK